MLFACLCLVSTPTAILLLPLFSWKAWLAYKGKDVAILATDSRELHEKIRIMASKRHLLLNVADTPHLCDFYLGAVVKKGDLKIGISTNGKSPTFAKRMRELFEDILPENINTILDNLR